MSGRSFEICFVKKNTYFYSCRQKQKMEREIESRLDNLEKRMEIIEDPEQKHLFKQLVAQVTGKNRIFILFTYDL